MRNYVSKGFGLYLLFLGFLLLFLCTSLVSFIFFDTQTVAAAPTNLISNPDFEITNSSQLPEGWTRGRWGVNTTSFSYPANSISGSKSGQVSISAYTSGDAKWAFTPVHITPGTEYQFRNCYLADVESHVTLQYQKTDGTFIYKDLAHLPPTSSLKETYMRFTAPDDVVTVSVFHLINQVGNLTVDCYSLIEYIPDPLNLIKNASFESLDNNGQPLHWKKGRWGTNSTRFTFPVSGYFGINGARVYTSANTSGDAKWYHEEVLAEGGRAYTFSDFYKSDTQSYVTAQFRMNDGSYRYRDLIMLYPTSEWRNTTRSFTTLSWTSNNADSVSFDQNIGGVSPASSGSVSISPTTETTYTGTFTGPNGTTACQTTVSVGGVPTTNSSLENSLIFQTPFAQTVLNTPSTGITPVAPLTYPAVGTTPAPMTLEIDADGHVLIRGIVQSTSMNVLTIKTWGGTWIVRTSIGSSVIPNGTGGVSDLSAIQVGDFVGVDGNMAHDQMFTVDATLVRDWTTNPYRAPASVSPTANNETTPDSETTAGTENPYFPDEATTTE